MYDCCLMCEEVACLSTSRNSGVNSYWLSDNWLQLVDSAMDQASEVFKTNEDHELLTSLKQAALQANKARVDELAQKFQEHSEQIQEVSVFAKPRLT